MNFRSDSYAPERFQTLTTRQMDVYQYLVECVRTRGRTPTVREIGLRFGIRSPNGVCCHLGALQRKGFLDKVPASSRGLQILIWPGAGPEVISKDGSIVLLAGSDEHYLQPEDAKALAEKLLAACEEK